jgi:hypothetical protein
MIVSQLSSAMRALQLSSAMRAVIRDEAFIRTA